MDEDSAEVSPADTRDSVEVSRERRRQAHKMQIAGALSAAAGHEFNNLMQTVLGSLELTRKLISLGRGAETEPFIAKAIADAKRVVSLNQRLGRFVRAQPVRPAALSINSVIKDVEDLLRYSFAHPYKLEFDLAAELWDTYCDANQAESAIIDLVLHARRSMPGGGTIVIATCNSGQGDGRIHADVAVPQYVRTTVSAFGGELRPPRNSRLAMARQFAREYGGAMRFTGKSGQRGDVVLELPRFTPLR